LLRIGMTSPDLFRVGVVDTEDSLREDYEIGMDTDGIFYVRYTGACNSCDFKFSYKHDEKVKV